VNWILRNPLLVINRSSLRSCSGQFGSVNHAHIDHSGNIPMLYREGYEGQVLCTPPTAELAEILLYDAASLNYKKLKQAEGDSKKKKKKMDCLMVKGDLYLQKDVEDTMSNFVTIQFNRRFKVKDGVWITLSLQDIY
jgi:metallo-beta-lactamase family protein